MAGKKNNPIKDIEVGCTIGIDASYTRTGVSIARNGELQKVLSIKYKGCKTKPEKRAQLKHKVDKYIKRYKPDIIIIERTRQFSTGDTSKKFIAMNMIKTGVSILTTIIDVGFENGLKTFSVDTRSWKSQVVGTSKGSNNNRKQPTIDFIKSLGFEVYDDDDAADSGCIALFYWYAAKKSGSKRRDELLRLEE